MKWEYVLIIALFGVIIMLLVMLYKLSVETALISERAHERSNTYTEGLLDRLMSMDFSEYKGAKLTEKLMAAHGREDTPVVQEEVRTVGPDRGGFGSKLGLRALSATETRSDPAVVEEELLGSH